MISRQKKRLSALISKKQNDLQRRYIGRQVRVRDFPSPVVGDFVDGAVRDRVLSIQALLDEHDLLEITHLEDARRRLELDDFGTCQNCGEPIEISRLLAVPETSLCYSCAEDLERHKSRSAELLGGAQDG